LVQTGVEVDAHVPDLPGDAVGAGENPPVHDDSSAVADAADHVEQATWRLLAGFREQRVLREGAGLRIVLENDGDSGHEQADLLDEVNLPQLGEAVRV